MLGEFSHVGIVVHDLERSVKCWTEILGYEEVGRLDVPIEGVRSVFLSPGQSTGQAAVIELIEPDHAAGDSVIARRLASNGPGMFHIAVLADDPAAESRRLREAGLTVLDLPSADGVGPRAVIHPRCVDGVLIEILPGRTH